MFNLANIKKTWYYLQKNGISDTYYAVRERLYARNSDLYPDKGYKYEPVSKKELERQRTVSFTNEYTFSILVPMYETKPEFAREMIDSVLAQTYPHWELILADASQSNLVKDTVLEYTDERIKYHRLEKNAGISENTNAALQYATGNYVGLLDHDDFLTPDALYEMALCLENAAKENKSVAFVYSDEDKCDSNGQNHYEPNIKPKFNFDLLLSNNYICHFLVMKTELMKKLKFRGEFDGAQDFDLVLRATLYKEAQEEILHVSKILYHWRCHDASTAANPRSKMYAYEAGKRAVQDAIEVFLYGQGCEIERTKQGILANQIPVFVSHTKHNGFYRINYGKGTAKDVFTVRKDVGIIAGNIKKNNRITGGIKNEEGVCPYAGLHVKFSGYLHRNVLVQNCEYVDLDNAVIRPELKELAKKEKLNLNLSDGNAEICRFIKESGYTILYDPLFEKKKSLTPVLEVDFLV